MKISVITAVRNRAGTIEQSIASVQTQTYKNIEHVIQDGGSTDGTLEIVSRMANARTCCESKRDAGIYDAINKGIERTTGDVVGLMHSDDFFASDTVLEKVADAFSDPDVDGVYGDLDYVSPHNTDKVVRHWQAGPYHSSLTARGWMPPHPSLYLRREVFERWGRYNTDYQIAADYEAFLRYATKGQIALAYVPEVLVKMRMGGTSNRSFGQILRKSREDLRAIRHHGVGGVGVLVQKNCSKLGQFFGGCDRRMPKWSNSAHGRARGFEGFDETQAKSGGREATVSW